MRTVAFVLNQTLVRDPGRLIRHCTAAARARGWEPSVVPTADAAVIAGADLVFAAGGDGTVRACAQALAGSGVPLAILPLGTANLAARALGIPHRVSHAVKAGFDGEDQRVDLARAEGSVFTRSSSAVDDWFNAFVPKRAPLTLACGDYDPTSALASGEVQPEGIELTWLSLPVEETFFRMLRL